VHSPNLESLGGEKFAAEVYQSHTDRNGAVTNFTLEYRDGTSEHFVLAEPDTIHQVLKWLNDHLSTMGSAGAGAAIGVLKGARGGIAGAVAGAAAKAVLAHLQPGAKSYYYNESKRPCFHGPVYLR